MTASATITINSLTWESNPTRVPSRGARLIADVTATVESGSGELDPYYWVAFGPGDETGITAGLDTSLQDGGVVAVPIAAGSTANGLITWDIAMVGPIRITVASNLAVPLTWMLDVAAPQTAPVTTPDPVMSADPNIALPESSGFEASMSEFAAGMEGLSTAVSVLSVELAPNGLPAVADTLIPTAEKINCLGLVAQEPIGGMKEAATCTQNGNEAALYLYDSQADADALIAIMTEAGGNPSWITWVDDRIMIVATTEADSIAVRQALGTF